MRATEVVEKLLVGRRLLQRVQLGAVEILEERIAEEVGVRSFSDDRRNGGETGKLRCAPASLTHDDLVGAADRSDDDRLQHADLTDRGGKLRQVFFVEDRAGLARVRNDEAERHLLVPCRDIDETRTVVRVIALFW